MADEDDKVKIQTMPVQEYDDIPVVASKQLIEIPSNSVLACERGIAFEVKTIGGEHFDHGLRISITVYDDEKCYQTSMQINRRLHTHTISCIAPMGDEDWPKLVAAKDSLHLGFLIYYLNADEDGWVNPKQDGVGVGEAMIENVPCEEGVFRIRVMSAKRAAHKGWLGRRRKG
ncbi:MAG: hypothetical protein D6772_06990 [Bacteroidetes bacterium]|nr:MAG: hypothetical protein D6772_06990 [Bacteroidota bacterium]